VQRNEAALSVLRHPDHQAIVRDITALERQSLGYAQAGRGNEAEQRNVHHSRD
jgi:hypothetical protein